MVAEEWYTGSILSIALGACNVMFFLSASLNEFLSPYLYWKSSKLDQPILLAIGISIAVLALSLGLFAISCAYKPKANKAHQIVEN